MTQQTSRAVHGWAVRVGTGELRALHPSLVTQGGKERTRTTSVDRLAAGPAVPPQACHLPESNCFPDLFTK